jgi:hypothetical protein
MIIWNTVNMKIINDFEADNHSNLQSIIHKNYIEVFHLLKLKSYNQI